MNNAELELRYEAARSWALHPISHPPSGWAHLVRTGMASLCLQQTPGALAPAAQTPSSAHREVSGLLLLVAAMIAEVCP